LNGCLEAQFTPWIIGSTLQSDPLSPTKFNFNNQLNNLNNNIHWSFNPLPTTSLYQDKVHKNQVDPCVPKTNLRIHLQEQHTTLQKDSPGQHQNFCHQIPQG